jgi:hypothetical protein
MMPRLASVVMPREVIEITRSFVAGVRDARPDLLHGLYLHGSLCWGEFFADSDIDFVAALRRRPDAADLAALSSVHAAVREQFPGRRYEGFYCTSGDLAAPPSTLGPVAVHFEGRFHPAGRVDVNPVTWHELAERGQVIVGGHPTIHVDLDALLAFTRDNLDTYWRTTLTRVVADGDRAIGGDDTAVVWIVLGVARLHHLLATHELTSKSGAGRYVLRDLDERWHRLAREALALRETPGALTSYVDPAERGRQVREFLTWMIEDGMGLDTPSR